MLVDGSNAKNLKMTAPAPEPEASGGSYPHSFHEPHMASPFDADAFGREKCTKRRRWPDLVDAPSGGHGGGPPAAQTLDLRRGYEASLSPEPSE